MEFIAINYRLYRLSFALLWNNIEKTQNKKKT